MDHKHGPLSMRMKRCWEMIKQLEFMPNMKDTIYLCKVSMELFFISRWLKMWKFDETNAYPEVHRALLEWLRNSTGLWNQSWQIDRLSISKCSILEVLVLRNHQSFSCLKCSGNLFYDININTVSIYCIPQKMNCTLCFIPTYTFP